MAKLDKDDLSAIGELIDVRINYALDNKLNQMLDEKIGSLPTKDEFYAETLKILKKLEDIEIEKDILSDHSSNHSDRLEKLEKIHPHYKHPTNVS